MTIRVHFLACVLFTFRLEINRKNDAILNLILLSMPTYIMSISIQTCYCNMQLKLCSTSESNSDLAFPNSILSGEIFIYLLRLYSTSAEGL